MQLFWPRHEETILSTSITNLAAGTTTCETVNVESLREKLAELLVGGPEINLINFIFYADR